MKLTVKPDGTMEFDVDTAAQALDIQAEIMRRQAPRSALQAPNPSMSDKYYQTWCFLVDNDCETGIHINHVARGLDIKNNAAGQRLTVMVQQGTAQRVSVGHYRAVMP